MKSNTIEINGRLYDAKTGMPINNSISVNKKRSTSSIRSIDGFSKAPVSKKTAHKQKHTVASTQKPTPKSSQAITTRTKPKNAGIKPKRSTTLKRNIVKAPQFASPAKKSVSKTIESPALKLRHATSDRYKRVESVTKSPQIKRFNLSPSNSHVQSRNKPQTNDSVNQSTTTKEVAEPEVLSTKEKLIRNALANADMNNHSKKSAKKPRTRTRAARYATSGLVVLLLASYVAYLNVPSISMRVAAQRAGFSASLPGYTPAGYSLNGPIAYSPGQVTVNFASNTDNRRFSLQQQPTTWDSTALLENYVAKQSPTHLTYQDRGLTIYIFNGSSAAWVNGSKMYIVEGQGSQLDTDQLLKLATSV